MSAPVFGWVDDDASLDFGGMLVDPVTAWLILTQGPQAQEGSASVFSILDAGDPGSVWWEGAVPERSLQTLIAAPRELTDEVNGQINEIVNDLPDVNEPRLYSLPLRRQSLPQNVVTDLRFSTVAFELPLSGPLPLPQDKIGPKPDVIVGIIDYAINPTHARFQYVGTDGKPHSRIAHFWLQDGAHAAPEVPFGLELNGAAIADAMATAQGDEEAALRALGLLHFGSTAEEAKPPSKTELARRLSHGTHVLDLAAGEDPFEGDGMRVQIIAVALPDSVRRETSGLSLSLFFLQGLEYILMRCRDIQERHKEHGSKAPPVLICASLGITGGPRGGRHAIEMGTDALLEQHHDDQFGGEARLYLPSGNSNLTRGHAVSTPGAGGGATLSVPWRLQPGDESPNHLEAWIAHPEGSPPDKVSLTLTPPGMPPDPQTPPGPLELAPDQARLLTRGPAGSVGAGVIGRAVLETTPEGPLRLSITLAGTDPAATGLPAAPAGAWGVEITAPAPAQEIAAWILRDDDPVGHSGNIRQSYFDALDYVERDRRGALEGTDPVPPGSAVRRAGTLNALATSPGREVVGGFVQPLKDTSGATPVSAAARYSGTPLPEGRELADPECVAWAAPSDSSPVLWGVLAAGTRSGSLVAMDGTSVAVPQIVRAEVAHRLGSTAPVVLPKEPGKSRPAPLGECPIRTPLPINRLDARAGRGEPRV